MKREGEVDGRGMVSKRRGRETGNRKQGRGENWSGGGGGGGGMGRGKKEKGRRMRGGGRSNG